MDILLSSSMCRVTNVVGAERSVQEYGYYSEEEVEEELAKI